MTVISLKFMAVNKLKHFFSRPKVWIPLILGGMVLLGALFIHPLTLVVDGKESRITGFGLTPKMILRTAGYIPQEQDHISPSGNSLAVGIREIQYHRARWVEVQTPNALLSTLTAEQDLQKIASELGLTFIPQDRMLQNGEVLEWSAALPLDQPLLLQFQPAKSVSVQINGQQTTFFTHQPTLGAALAEAGIVLLPEDRSSLPLSTFLETSSQVSIAKARPLHITLHGMEITGLTAAKTVGEALADLNLPLQGLDYSIPLESEPLPADGRVHVVHVEEKLDFTKLETPFTNTTELDPNTELDTTSVLVPGQVGLEVTRSRSRFEDGTQVSLISEGPWKASEPANGVIGRGTKAVLHTEVVDGVTLTWWRKLSVYATGYNPTSNHGTGTASGMKLTKGIIAVSVPWYNSGLAFQKVYVPGYGFGTIADTGGGIPGTPWIDLGFDDDNYVSWHHWTTLYLLEPIPAYYPAVMP